MQKRIDFVVRLNTVTFANEKLRVAVNRGLIDELTRKASIILIFMAILEELLELEKWG